jgi:hypothetical protein
MDKRGIRYLSKIVCSFVLSLTVLLSQPAAAQSITLPSPAAGSFISTFDYINNGRLVAFDGFTVSVQQSIGSTTLVPIGTLPPSFLGGTDPAFIRTSPNGQFFVLGGGAGGSKFPDPAFNGSIFTMPAAGGQATLIGLFSFSIFATFRHPGEFFFGQGETFGTFTGSVELLNLSTGTTQHVIGPIPGDPGGIAFDHAGDLFVGLGAGQDTARTGEIREFSRQLVDNAIQTGTSLAFDSGVLIIQILNAGDLRFDSTGDLFVGGANFNGRPTGFFAEVNVATGQVINQFNPVGLSGVFYELAFTPVMCKLGAVDVDSFFTGRSPTVFEFMVCSGGP